MILDIPFQALSKPSSLIFSFKDTSKDIKIVIIHGKNLVIQELSFSLSFFFYDDFLSLL